ncbi:MAG TPA: D-alanyl-D-alanine carboxypeptidase/D-alanyl-D-alanine-endopeptidase [Gaiellaceae bacterium]|nr:D-alanyl-D-alanine carboxypeptidase/D-alanyl-D-alanine-endopeptidase [Gaiellaceae bacterium]
MPLRLAATAVAIVAFFLVPAAQAGSGSTFQAQLARALRARHVSPARTGAIVLDLQTGETLFAHYPGLPLRPASNEKLATTYAALTALGPSFRIETDVLGDGQQSGANWQGNLVLKGYGDPALSFAQLNSLARQVAADGIKHVSGRILGDESWFDTRRTGVGWKPAFYLHESPALSALIVNRGWTGRSETTRPALMAAQVFRNDLRHAGVSVHGGAAVGAASAQAAPLGDVESAPLSALVRHMDVYSDNFYAEMMIKEVGAVQGSGGSSSAGVAVERRLLREAGVPLTGVRMVDGSGLSLIDRWTPLGLSTLLRTMWQDPDLRPYLVSALPIAGETGTLEYRMRRPPAHGLVRAKTGTTDNSSALSGFVGTRYAFSILENGSPVNTLNAEQSQNRFGQVLARAARSSGS